jgi:NAD(P)-dependent dehydrogenase (short-subunit alcohol dehydrogenase family)
MEGKAVLVTGVASGIGLAAALALPGLGLGVGCLRADQAGAGLC